MKARGVLRIICILLILVGSALILFSGTIDAIDILSRQSGSEPHLVVQKTSVTATHLTEIPEHIRLLSLNQNVDGDQDITSFHLNQIDGYTLENVNELNKVWNWYLDPNVSYPHQSIEFRVKGYEWNAYYGWISSDIYENEKFALNWVSNAMFTETNDTNVYWSLSELAQNGTYICEKNALFPKLIKCNVDGASEEVGTGLIFGTRLNRSGDIISGFTVNGTNYEYRAKVIDNQTGLVLTEYNETRVSYNNSGNAGYDLNDVTHFNYYIHDMCGNSTSENTLFVYGFVPSGENYAYIDAVHVNFKTGETNREFTSSSNTKGVHQVVSQDVTTIDVALSDLFSDGTANYVTVYPASDDRIAVERRIIDVNLSTSERFGNFITILNLPSPANTVAKLSSNGERIYISLLSNSKGNFFIYNFNDGNLLYSFSDNQVNPIMGMSINTLGSIIAHHNLDGSIKITWNNPWSGAWEQLGDNKIENVYTSEEQNLKVNTVSLSEDGFTIYYLNNSQKVSSKTIDIITKGDKWSSWYRATLSLDQQWGSTTRDARLFHVSELHKLRPDGNVETRIYGNMGISALDSEWLMGWNTQDYPYLGFGTLNNEVVQNFSYNDITLIPRLFRDGDTFKDKKRGWTLIDDSLENPLNTIPYFEFVFDDVSGLGSKDIDQEKEYKKDLILLWSTATLQCADTSVLPMAFTDLIGKRIDEIPYSMRYYPTLQAVISTQGRSGEYSYTSVQVGTNENNLTEMYSTHPIYNSEYTTRSTQKYNASGFLGSWPTWNNDKGFIGRLHFLDYNSSLCKHGDSSDDCGNSFESESTRHTGTFDTNWVVDSKPVVIRIQHWYYHIDKGPLHRGVSFLRSYGQINNAVYSTNTSCGRKQVTVRVYVDINDERLIHSQTSNRGHSKGLNVFPGQVALDSTSNEFQIRMPDIYEKWSGFTLLKHCKTSELGFEGDGVKHLGTGTFLDDLKLDDDAHRLPILQAAINDVSGDNYEEFRYLYCTYVDSVSILNSPVFNADICNATDNANKIQDWSVQQEGTAYDSYSTYLENNICSNAEVAVKALNEPIDSDAAKVCGCLLGSTAVNSIRDHFQTKYQFDPVGGIECWFTPCQIGADLFKPSSGGSCGDYQINQCFQDVSFGINAGGDVTIDDTGIECNIENTSGGNTNTGGTGGGDTNTGGTGGGDTNTEKGSLNEIALYSGIGTLGIGVIGTAISFFL